jgi:hypothetical protein
MAELASNNPEDIFLRYLTEWLSRKWHQASERAQAGRPPLALSLHLGNRRPEQHLRNCDTTRLLIQAEG